MIKMMRAAIVAAALTTSVTAIAAAPVGAENIGREGCTPGYWKNHPDSWQIPGVYFPSLQLRYLQLVFPTQLSSFANMTMMQALQGVGGPGVDGAARILLRATVAAYLNAEHEGVGYPYRRFTTGGIRDQVNAALASLNRQRMLDLATKLDRANNLGCPL